jgi:hypothetical protein
MTRALVVPHFSLLHIFDGHLQHLFDTVNTQAYSLRFEFSITVAPIAQDLFECLSADQVRLASLGLQPFASSARRCESSLLSVWSLASALHSRCVRSSIDSLWSVLRCRRRRLVCGRRAGGVRGRAARGSSPRARGHGAAESSASYELAVREPRQCAASDGESTNAHLAGLFEVAASEDYAESRSGLLVICRLGCESIAQPGLTRDIAR